MEGSHGQKSADQESDGRGERVLRPVSNLTAHKHLLEQNLEKIEWGLLSCNTNAMHLLEKKVEKLNWFALSSNPSISTKKTNHAFLRQRLSLIRKELINK